MNLTIGNDLALAFGLLFARTSSVLMALPALLGVDVPIRIRLLLAALIAAALTPVASLTQSRIPGAVPMVILLLRELAIGMMLGFASAVVVGAVMTAGSIVGGSMELNSGAVLRGSVESPNVLADALGAFAGLLFFVAGFHRMLIVALVKSLRIAPLGAPSLPAPTQLLAAGGRVFGLALALSFPMLVPLFVLSIAEGVIARAVPQVNVLLVAPAAIVMAGLILLALDATGLGAGIVRAWMAAMTEAMGWLDG